METNTETTLGDRAAAILSPFAMIAMIAALIWNYRSLTVFEIAWLGFFIATTLIRLPFSKQNKSNDITVDANTVQERILLFGMFASMAVLPMIYLITKGTPWGFLAFADYQLSPVVATFGVCLIFPYAFLFWRSHSDLGRNWSPRLEMHDTHSLVTEGVYKHIRHPMYAAIWIAVLAQPLLIHNWIAGGMIVVAFSAMYVLRIPKEEEMMIGQFGSEYKDYMSRTGRIFPKR